MDTIITCSDSVGGLQHSPSQNDDHLGPRPNFDILIHIMKFVPQVLLVMMRTCRVLYPVGIKCLLANPPILDSAERVLAFCNFMLADASRFTLLRTLELAYFDYLTPLPSSTMSILTRILSHAHSLRTLAFGQRDLDSDPLTQFFGEVSIVVGAVQSALVELRADFVDGFLPDAHVILEASPKSLQILDLRGVTWATTAITPYPELRRLTVRFSEAGRDIGLLVGLFPNLSHLEFAEEHWRTTLGEMGEVRERNERGSPGRRWSRLEYFGGDFGSIYSAGLGCEVKHLNIRRFNGESIRLLTSILSDIRPRSLSLEVDYFIPGIYNHMFQNNSNITELVMTLHTLDGLVLPPSSDYGTLQASVLEMLTPLQLKSLTLLWRIDATYSTQSRSNDASQCLRRLDVHAFVKQLAQRLLTLREVTMDVPRNTVSRRYWKIERSDDGGVQERR
ncbi:hypothetical protein OBBRIDRAFT_798727 [Obba rivulosa]|uniref:Uncharacterized protein n=1 Tax=Obba rivulosa TaxID=1052685 RepID=A0A8E2AI06_9APHY|nr:hypothetical protein OBBRIDRAFT_798727 [Obba rivulosa]